MLQNQTGNKPSQVFRQKIWAGKKGISIIEILVVIAILGVVLTSLLGLVSFSLKGSSLIKQNHQANNLAQEIIEVVRNFRDQTVWDTTGLGTLTVDTAYYPEKTADVPPKWSLVSGEETIGIFNRKVVFERVYRDTNDDIADSGTEDPDTKKATVTVSWQERERDHQIELVTYFTNWQQ